MTYSPALSLPNSAEDSQLLMKKHGKTFYFASQFLGKERGGHVARLYALCRFIDDCADELEKGESLKELQSLRSNLDQYIEGINVEKEYLNELLKGAEFDANEGKINTKKDLLTYCYRVAGAVGLMMNPLIGAVHKYARPFSIDLGLGMQLTNICRDVLEDAQNDRFYLPEYELARLGIGKSDLKKQGDAPMALKEMVKSYLDLADIYYESAKQGYAYIPFRPRLAILLAGDLYREIGKEIRRNGYEVLRGRTYIPFWKKCLVSFKALKSLFSISFWKKGHKHESYLHEDLKGLPGAGAP